MPSLVPSLPQAKSTSRSGRAEPPLCPCHQGGAWCRLRFPGHLCGQARGQCGVVCSLCGCSTGRALSHLPPASETWLTRCLGGPVGDTCKLPAPAVRSQLHTWGSLSAGCPAAHPSLCLVSPAPNVTKPNNGGADGRHPTGHFKGPHADRWPLILGERLVAPPPSAETQND